MTNKVDMSVTLAGMTMKNPVVVRAILPPELQRRPWAS